MPVDFPRPDGVMPHGPDVASEGAMQPSFAERIDRILQLCAALDAARDDVAVLITQSEALSHEAGLLAAEAAEDLVRQRRENLRLTPRPSSSEDTGGSSQ